MEGQLQYGIQPASQEENNIQHRRRWVQESMCYSSVVQNVEVVLGAYMSAGSALRTVSDLHIAYIAIE